MNLHIIHQVLGMALVAFGAGVTDMRGSIGGTTASRNKAGAYFRARVAPINRKTPAQTQVRANFASGAKLWSGTFTPAERAAWTAFAVSNPLVNILGASIIVSGIAMAQKLNQVLQQIGQPVISSPPPDLSVPALAAVEGAVAVAATPELNVDTGTQAVVAGASYYIFATRPLSGGTTPQTSDYRYLAMVAAVAAAEVITLADAYTALYGAWLPGASIGVAVATVNTDSGAVTPAVINNIIST